MEFVATTTADANACAGTGTPPPVSPAAPLRTADLAPVQGNGTPAQRRTLAVVIATVTDQQLQSGFLEAFSSASALRGGRYVARGERVGLEHARVVRDATTSGELTTTSQGITGTLCLTGPAIADGRLSVGNLDRHGTATGTLDGRPVRLEFRFG